MDLKLVLSALFLPVTEFVTENAISCIILRSLNAIFDSVSVLQTIAESAGLKPTVNEINLYSMIKVVCLCVNSSSLPSLYLILYHFDHPVGGGVSRPYRGKPSPIRRYRHIFGPMCRCINTFVDRWVDISIYRYICGPMGPYIDFLIKLLGLSDFVPF